MLKPKAQILPEPVAAAVVRREMNASADWITEEAVEDFAQNLQSLIYAVRSRTISDVHDRKLRAIFVAFESLSDEIEEVSLEIDSHLSGSR